MLQAYLISRREAALGGNGPTRRRSRHGQRQGGATWRHAARGLVCYFFAIIWGFAGVASGLATGSLPL